AKERSEPRGAAGKVQRGAHRRAALRGLVEGASDRSEVAAIASFPARRFVAPRVVAFGHADVLIARPGPVVRRGAHLADSIDSRRGGFPPGARVLPGSRRAG